MGIMDWILRRGSNSGSDEEEKEEPEIYVYSSPELLIPTNIPKYIMRKAWGILEKDAALTYLTEKEMKWLQYKVEQVARLYGLISLEVYHPELASMLDRLLNTLIDELNTEIIGYLRLKRSIYGFERRATFYPAR